MNVAVVPPKLSMYPTMPPIVSVASAIVEAIVPTFYPIVNPIMFPFSPVVKTITAPSAMLRVEAERAHGQQ